MLDRQFSNEGHKMRVTYDEDSRVYKGRIKTDTGIDYIYGDTMNEVLDEFDELVESIIRRKYGRLENIKIN